MYRTRKEKLEKIVMRGNRLTDAQAAAAWKDLMRSLDSISDPFFPRTPKFRDLLTSLVYAYARAERGIVRSALRLETVAAITAEQLQPKVIA